MISVTFHGAAGTVTGSKYLVECGGESILIDCGMFQGAKILRERNWIDPAFDPGKLSAIVLTHAHVDHVGYLPRMVRQGFARAVFATPPTCEIASITLRDTAQIQEEDAEYRNKKRATRHDRALPLFTSDDAETAIGMFNSTPFGSWTQIGQHFRFKYHIVGHLLGAACVELEVTYNGQKRTILFSGDIGRYSGPMVVDPLPPPPCDYFICESTYGGRIHEPEDPFFALAALIDEVVAQKRVLLIPAFAIGRTQQIIYMLNLLERDGRIPHVPVHIDSPMAISATDIFAKYSSYHKLGENPADVSAALEGKGVTLHRRRESSKELNTLNGPAIIISASGMMTGGRIMHHLINRLPNKSTTVAVVGFLPEGTVGRRLLNGDKTVYIHKQLVEVNAKIVKISGLSGHADYFEILHWLKPMESAPKRVFITHGEPDQSTAMAGHLRNERGWECTIPKLGDRVELA